MAPLLFNDPMPLVAQMVKRLTAMWETRVRFRRGSLRNGYHIQGRQQAPDPRP